MPTLMTTAACLDPTYVQNVDVNADHAPVVGSVDPTGTFLPIPAKIGVDCAATLFHVRDVEDPDLDVLTVRWSLVVPRTGAPQDRATERLKETELHPLEEPSATTGNYDETTAGLEPFELSRSLILSEVGGGFGTTQLLELRISDGGFTVGTNDAPPGKALVYRSWLVALADEDCVLP